MSNALFWVCCAAYLALVGIAAWNLRKDAPPRYRREDPPPTPDPDDDPAVDRIPDYVPAGLAHWRTVPDIVDLPDRPDRR